MSDETYEAKMQSLQQYIPFLVNMMGELKAKGNRKAQLEKMQSLHCMITDSSKKLKLETLNKCEEVLKNIYLKVNPQLLTKVIAKPNSVPTPEGSTASPNNLIDVEAPKINDDAQPHPKNIIKSANVTVVEDNRSSNVPTVLSKVVDPRRPIIDLDDVQENVQQKIFDVEYDSKSVHELEEFKKQLHQQLHLAEAVYQINKSSDSENGKSDEKSKSGKEIKSPKSHMKSSAKNIEKDTVKIIKEFDMFENLDSATTKEKNIPKKGDRRSSTASLDSDGNRRHKDHKDKDKHKHKDKKKDRHSDSKNKNNRHSKEKKHKEDKKAVKDNQSDVTSSDGLQTPSETKTNTDTEIDIQSLKNSLKRFVTVPVVESIDLTKSDPENKPVDKSLADKFNPKPDVDKAVSDRIESTMDAFPIRSLINSLGNKNVLSPPKKPVVIPEILQQIVSRISLRASEKTEPIIPFLNDPRSKPEPQTNVIQSFESPLSPPLQQPTVFHLPRHIPLAPSPTLKIVPPLMQRTGTGILTTPPAVYPHVDHGEVNMDLGTPRSDFSTPRAEFGTPRADFGTPRGDFGTPRADFGTPRADFGTPRADFVAPRLDFIAPRTDFVAPRVDFVAPRADFVAPRVDFVAPRTDFVTPSADFRHDYNAVMTPRADFNSPPSNNYAQSQFIGNNQFDMFTPEKQMHSFNQRNDNNFMEPGHFAQQQGNMSAYDLAQNAIIVQNALNMSNNYNSYQASQGFYPKGNQMQINANYEQSNYFPEQQPLYQERSRWPGRHNERGRRQQGPTSYGEYREMRERHEREAKMAQEHSAIKDPRLKPREIKDEDVKDTTEVDIKDPRLSRARERIRSRDRSRSPTEEKVETRDPRLKAKLKDSKFDKLYSKYGQKKEGEDNEEVFASPLNSLYNAKEGRTGRGYGVQSFKIPKKNKKEEIIKDQIKIEEKRSSSETQISVSSSTSTMQSRSSASDEPSSSADVQTLNSSSNDEQNLNSTSDKLIISNDQQNLSSSSDKKNLNSNSDKKSLNISSDKKSLNVSSDKKSLNISSDKKSLNINNDKQNLNSSSDEQNLNKSSDKQKLDSSCDKSNLNSSSVTQNLNSSTDKYDKQSISRPNTRSRSKKRIVSESDESETILGAAECDQVPIADTTIEHNEKDVHEVQNLENPKYDIIFKHVDVWNASEQSIEETNFVSEYDLEFENEAFEETTTLVDSIDESNEDPDEDKHSSESKNKLPDSIDKPSSSKNDLELHPPQAILVVDEKIDEEKSITSTETPEEPEVDSNEALHETATNQEATSKDSSPDIFQIVKGALDTRIAEDPSSTICTLLETVLGKLDPQQMQMVRKIVSKEESNKSDETPKEQQIDSTTVEENSNTVENQNIPTNTTYTTNETQVNEVTESIKHSETEDSLIEGNQDDLYKEPIIVSVGERIKNRKRASHQVVPTAAQQKKKSELDLLHADIQDMFIRDGVLKATGKRKCALNNDNNVPITNEPQSTNAPTLDESKVIKRRGPKRKATSYTSEIPMLKQIKIVLKKIPEDILTAVSARSRQTSLAESDFSENVSYDYSVSEFEEESLKEFEETHKRRPRRRKLAKWASGIISKPKKKKTQEQKSKESSPVRSASVASETASLSDTDITEMAVEPDINYYYDYTTKNKITCKLCPYSGHWMTVHYLKDHPESEVLTSRLPPHVAAEAIEDFALNEETYAKLANKKIFQKKFQYSCRMCGYATHISPQYFYEHLTTHTGEYRHECSRCEYVAASEKSMSGHYLTLHPNRDKNERIPPKRFNCPIVFAYMCSECNFVQLKKKNVLDHLKVYHLGDKPTVHKINMSTVTINLQLTKGDSSDFSINDSRDTSSERVSKTRACKPNVQIIEHKKPGPKSKTMPVVQMDNATKSDEAETLASTRRRKPGPKSKTLQKSNVPVSGNTTEQESEAEMPVLRSKSRSTRASSPKQSHEDVTPARKRRRSLDKLINDDSKEDLDEIITLSSRSSRAAKEKATAKLKSLMESNESSPIKRRSDQEIANRKSVEEESDEEKSEHIQSDEEPADVLTPIKDQSDKEAAKVNRSGVNEMAPPIVENKSSEKDLNVFTCSSDILQEQAKTIEEDRLRQMDELSKSFASKPKLDFINKLSNRINSAQQLAAVSVKREPNRCDTFVMPILEKQVTESSNPIVKPTTPPAIVKKPVIEEEPSCSIKFRQNKVNSLFSSTIQKLQGKINEAVQEDSSRTNENAELSIQDDDLVLEKPESFISIGDLIRASKIGSDIVYSCHVNQCKFTSKDKTVFKMHCKLGIHKNLQVTSSLCDRCGVIISITQDTTLLENLYDHLVFAHEDFLSPMSLLRMRRMSGDKLSIKKEKDGKTDDPEEQKSKEIVPLQDIEAELDTCVLMAANYNPQFSISNSTPPLSLQMIKEPSIEEVPAASTAIIEPSDHQFGFKIVEVTSLADSESNATLSPVKPAAAALTKLPPLVLVNQEELAPQSKVIREAKLTTLESSRPRKGAKALQSLIETPSNLYKCPHFFCKFSSNVRAMFVFHLREHISENATMVPCVYCDVKTPWDHVPMHIDIRHAASRHTCGHCLYRAVAPEYVCLHLEQCHPNNEYIVISVPPHKAAKKFSAADMKIDCKQLCEPFRCVCENEDGELKAHEYLFEDEFMKHLLRFHKQGLIKCGYPRCVQTLHPSLMLNHWAMFHGVRTYQCSYCKTNSKEIQRMYSHFAQAHPNMMPNILVRKNESSLPQHKEVGFTDEAYLYLGHIRKFPTTLIGVIKKRSKFKRIKIIESDASITSEESTTTLTPPKTSPSNALFLPIAQNNTQLLLTNPNLQLLVASTSTNDKVLVLSGKSIVSQSTLPSVTSTASIGKVLGQTSTAPALKHRGKVLLQSPVGSTSPPNLVPIRVGAQASTGSPTHTLKSQAPVRIGGITIYPSDVPEDNTLLPLSNSPGLANQGILTTASTTASSGNVFYTSAIVKDTAKRSQQEVPNIAEVLPISNAIRTENNSPILNEDHILQSAIQSILDFGDESNNTQLDSLFARSSMPPEHSSENPPPLVLISNSISNNSAVPQNKEVMAPMEHINLDDPQDELLQLESIDESGSELFIDEGNPISEDPLSLLLNSDVLDLEAPSSESLEPLVAPASVKSAPQKLSVLRRSGSSIGSTDEESDGSSSEKKTSGLLGYQLYRCAICNLSFSTFEAFKKHISTSITCKKVGIKPYQCAHCYKRFKTTQRLAKHIFNHGVLRFFCGLCNEKFNTVESTKMHLKTRHSILQYSMAPLKADKNDMEVDEFMFIPRKENEAAASAPKLSVDSCTYNPDEINAIPIRQIFNTNVKCGKCNYQTKVRVNIIRHLQMHLDEKAVPDSAPVNPVPCLEKNEKMFDKMCNLAASSFPTGRMGGPPAVKENDQDKEKHPEFVPSHRRFVCCAQGCSYLCPEESNLKHHIMALHSDEANFTCAHCKVAINSSEVENVIKHFKLHGLHLYKCQYCSFVNHLKHKVEKHISDGHLDLAIKVITVRYLDSEPEFTSEHHDAATPQTVIPSPKFKPWTCCMCKAKYYTKDEILTHIVKKHNIDAQYKCTLCPFKHDQENVCRAHFKEKHPDIVFDIILVYREAEEESQEVASTTPFDTTPLWQRDKPRVRHIRGILFDESSPPPTKSPKKKVLPKFNTTWKMTPVASTSSAKNTPSPVPAVRSIVNRNIFDCIDAVARGTAETLQEKCFTEADYDKPGPSGISTAKTTSATVPRDNSSTSSDESIEASPEKIQNKIGKMPPITLVSKNKSKQKPSISSEATSNEPVILNKFFSNPTHLDDTLKLNLSLDKIINNALDTSATTSTPNQDSKIDSADESDDVVLISPPIPNITVIDSDESDVESRPFKFEPQESNSDATPNTSKGSKRPGATDLLQEAVKMARIDETDDAVVANGCSRENLVYLFGAIGKPNNKQLKCPRCSTFRSKKAADFIFHLYQEFNFHRYRCKGCDYSSVTYKFMLDHLQMHHPDATADLSLPLPPNIQLDTWIQMVIREQSKEILELTHELFQKRPVTGVLNNKCYFCNDTFSSVSECNEHMFYHWVLMPYQCQHCPNEFYTVYDLRHHHSIEHPDLVLYPDPKGPTLAQALACIENTKKKTLKTYSTSDQKKARLEESKEKKNITSGTVINTHKMKNSDLFTVSNREGISTDGDDIFACEICAYYGFSEANIKQHLQKTHQILINKFHILSKSKLETDQSKMACNVCNAIFTELQLRQHFLEKHDATFVPYKYKCLSCHRKFSNIGMLKSHCTKFHPLSRPSYECVVTKNKFAFDTATSKSKCVSKFSCSLCNFISVAQTAQYIRSHVKGHFRPAVCNICQMSFRNHYEIISHTDKVHKGLEPDYSISSIINRECNKVIANICSTATPVEQNSTSKAENSTSTKQCAKKSTASQSNSRTRPDQDEEGYSFYGMDEPEVDLANLQTTFFLNNLEYTTTAEEMKKMVNLDVYVDLSDCLVDENNATESS